MFRSWCRLSAWWQSLPGQFRYLVVGGLNTLAGYGVFGIVYLVLSGTIPYLGILAVAHFMAVTFSFVTHRYWVFGAQSGQLWREYWRFQGSYLWLVPQSLALSLGMVKILGWSPWLAQAVTMVFGVATAFVLHRFLVFRRSL